MSALKRLDSFFDDEINLSYLCDSRTRFSYLLKNVCNFDQLSLEMKIKIKDFCLKKAKNNYKAFYYIQLAESIIESATQNNLKQWNWCLEYYKKALVNLPFNTQLGKNHSYISWKISQLLERNKKFDQALDSINQAIELANKNKDIEYFPMMIKLKIEILIKMKRFSDAYKTLELANQSSTVGLVKHDQLNQLQVEYNQMLLPYLTELNYNTIDENSENEIYLFELDTNCSIESNRLKGRHVRSMSSIPNGTYLLRERILNVVLYPHYKKQKCSQCYRSIDYIFYPCRTCTENVFCNIKCEQLAFNGGMHQIECRIGSYLSNNVIASHVYRLISTIGIETAVQFYRDLEETAKKRFDIQDYLKEVARLCLVPFESMDKNSQLKTLSVISTFVDHCHRTVDNDEDERQRWAIKIILIINHHQHYFDDIEFNDETLNDFFLLTENIALLMRKLQYNVFGWTECDMNDLNTNRLIGNCLCLVSSFFNHSCDSNTYWDIADGVIAITSTSNIEPNDEVTISYIPNSIDPLIKRQNELDRYNFTCTCSRCIDDSLKTLCLRCNNCNGPINPIETIGNSSVFRCMSCGHRYENYCNEMTTAIQCHIRLQFVYRYGIAWNNVNISHHVECIQQLFENIVSNVYSRCDPLLLDMLQAYCYLLENDKWEDASKLFQSYFMIPNETNNRQNEYNDRMSIERFILLKKWLQTQCEQENNSMKIEMNLNDQFQDNEIRKELTNLQNILKKKAQNYQLYNGWNLIEEMLNDSL